jgi:preprotein translocase subunit YajC
MWLRIHKLSGSIYIMMRIFALFLLLAQQSLMARDAAVPDANRQSMDVNQLLHSAMLLGVFFIGMWFLLIAPQRKRTKELEATLKSLKAGDKVVTNSGILAVVLSIKDKTLSIRSADSKLEILKSSVLEVIERGGEPSESKS